MSNNAKISLIHSKDELLQVITKHTKKAQKIVLHCSNFDKISFVNNAYKATLSLNEWLILHLQELQSRQSKPTIEVHNYGSIDKNSVFSNLLKQENTLTIYEKQSDNAINDILYNFVKELNGGKNTDNLSSAISEFLKHNNVDTLTNCIKNYLQKPIIEKISVFDEMEFFGNKEHCKNSIENTFSNIIEDIEAIYNDGNKQIYKELVNFFFGIVNIFDIKSLFSKANLPLFAVGAFFEGAKMWGRIDEWLDSKYKFTISNAIIELFIEDIAPIILLFQNRILNHSLIIDNRVLIEISGFKCDLSYSKATIGQNLAVCLEFKQELNLNSINPNLQNKNTKICGKKDIAKILDRQMASSNNRLSYIESPCFNSAKLVHFIKNKEEKNSHKRDPAKQGYNYLIISNAPQKYNAKLTQRLLQELGSSIDYGNNSSEFKSNSLHKNPINYNPIMDYSKYTITTKDKPNKPYVVHLSPFIFMPQKRYNELKEIEYKISSYESDIYNRDTFLEKEHYRFKQQHIDDINSFRFIESFFEKSHSKQAILEQEKKYFKEGIQCLRNYIDSIITVIESRDISFNRYDIDKDAQMSMVEKTTKKPKTKYDILEVILLALTYYVIKHFYTSIEIVIKKQRTFSVEFESIKIDEEIIDILPFKAFLIIEDKEIPLCFSKQQKEKLKYKQEVFCIEEFVLKLEKYDDNDDKWKEYLNNFLDDGNMDDFDSTDNTFDAIEKELQTSSQNDENHEQIIHLGSADKYIDIVIEDFIISFFPFADILFNISGFDIAKHLTKTMIRTYRNYWNAMFEEFGLAYIMKIMTDKNLSFNAKKYSKTTKAQKRFKKLKKKAFIQYIILLQNDKYSQILATSSKKIKGFKQMTSPSKIQNAKGIFLKQYWSTKIIESLQAIAQDIILNIFNENFITHYEQTKVKFEKLQFLHFIDKYNPPYSLKRQEGVFYPMCVNNTFLSFNFKNMIVGGKLCTGAFGTLESLFFSFDNQTMPTKNYLLNKLIAYLCLDELRSMNDSLATIDDIDFFNNRQYLNDLSTPPRYLTLINSKGTFKTSPNANNQTKDNIAKQNKKMQNIAEDKRRQSLYDEYRSKQLPEIEAIEAYHTVMNYLDDVYMDCFDVNSNNNKPNHKKHRAFLKALEIIGQNNIKAMYVGLDKDNKAIQNTQETSESRPKLIGRLATTIIMKDGLSMG
ncbi:hypothetical protein [Campylobacter troglodytis]|uniref:hypothetical protein n=1 Tax=Campylobacter troglodytis TaxID=654363 RepID=UPI00115C2EC0|nr:hypothetical protein [Campylobacter troglodytis]TQR53119.1 hypothetical protein DMC01_11995 [Campylobacter troglodytis]